MSHEVHRSAEFPFPDDEFPENLGAVVQRTVMDGREPARVVIHDRDGDWLVGDAVNDPNEAGACLVNCMHCVVSTDPTLASLASLPLGYQAVRDDATQPWTLLPHSYEDD